jgi:hypothetical protein
MLIEPVCVSGSAREEPEAKKCDSGGGRAFNDEKPVTESGKSYCWGFKGFSPSPACKPTNVVQAGKDTCSDEARKPRCKNLGAV